LLFFPSRCSHKPNESLTLRVGLIGKIAVVPDQSRNREDAVRAHATALPPLVPATEIAFGLSGG
ncbi:MAG: hypothetical protein WA441_01810, partial [Methyloceanibacter sp.]